MVRFRTTLAGYFYAGCLMAGANLFAFGCWADEVIVQNQPNFQTTVGDFRCSSCPEQVAQSLQMLGGSNQIHLTAGELWQFFNQQGVDSIDRLTLCLDVEQLDHQSSFDLRSMQFQIEAPGAEGDFLTDVSLGRDSLVVPGESTSSAKPEAKLEISLDYDFMQRFSANSTELITIDFSSVAGESEIAVTPKISIEGNGNVFSKLNPLLLVGFACFWLVVFFVLNRVTKPLIENKLFESSADPTPTIPLPTMARNVLPEGPSAKEIVPQKRVYSA